MAPQEPLALSPGNMYFRKALEMAMAINGGSPQCTLSRLSHMGFNGSALSLNLSPYLPVSSSRLGEGLHFIGKEDL